MKKVAIIDYGVGNIKSIINAVSSLRCTVLFTSSQKEISSSDAIILPGVGAYKEGMSNLIDRGLDTTIKEYSQTGRPVLGICLGMQLLLENSHEFGFTQGLGLIKGSVERLPSFPSLAIPHIGWEEVSFSDGLVIEDFFFCHSFYASPTDRGTILGTTLFGDYSFCSVVKKDNITGFQFHPEKSGEAGLNLLEKFVL